MAFVRRYGAIISVAAAIALCAAGPTANAASAATGTGSGLNYGGSGHTFDSVDGPGGALIEAWSRDLGGTSSTPLIVGSVVVAASLASSDDGQREDVQAFDASTGRPLWAPLAVGTAQTTLASDGQRVFVTSGQNLIAISLTTGRQLWSSLVSSGVPLYNTPALEDGLLWVNSGSTGLQALDPATGAIVHRYPDDRGSAPLAAVGTTLYGSECAVDTNTGTTKWVHQGISGCHFEGGLAQSDGNVVVTPAYGGVNALGVLDAATGQSRYNVPPGQPALGSGQLTVATPDKHLNSYDEVSGVARWSVPLAAQPTAPPVLFTAQVAVTTADGHLRRYALSDGSLVDDTALPATPPFSTFGMPVAAAADSGLLAVPAANTLTVFRGSTTSTPAPASPAAPVSMTLPPPASGADTADGSQYAQNAAHDGTANGSTLHTPLSRKWQVRLPGQVSNAVIDPAGRLFVGNADPSGGVDISRYNRQTGAVDWGPVHLTGGTGHSRLAVSGAVLVDYEYGTQTGAVLHGLDATTGTLQWTTQLPTAFYGYDGYPTIAADKVFVHSYSDQAGGAGWALDLATGRVAWTGIDTNDYFSVAPAADSKFAYFSGVGDQLAAFDTATGSRAYASDSGYDGGGAGDVVLGAGKLYLNDYAGGGKVVDAATGQFVGSDFVTRRPALDTAHNAIVALQGNRIVAERLGDRARYWVASPSQTLDVSPSIANGLVLTGDSSGRLFALDEATGATVWTDATAFAAAPPVLGPDSEPATLTVGAGALALTSGNSLKLYSGQTDNGPVDTPPPAAVSLSGPANRATTYGSTVTLSGTANPGATVKVWFRQAGATAFVQRRTLTASPTGSWTTSYIANDDYRVYAANGGTTSQPVLVQVAPTIDGAASRTAPKNSTVTITGTGTASRTVTLHLHKAGTAATDYSIVRTATIDSNGKWSWRYVASVDYRLYATLPNGQASQAVLVQAR